MLQTRFTRLFGLDYPLMSAPMSMHSGSALATAVSNVGALGSFGGINLAGPDWLRGEIRRALQQTRRPFAVGFITHLIPVFPELFDTALQEGVKTLAFSFADAARYVEKAKAAGARVICQVQSMRHAREAVAAGADLLVAQGNEAGGHTGTMNLLPLLVNVLDAYPDLPVLAAGGISSGRALAAVLAAGADGAWVGTALLATNECAEVPDAYKRAIVESDGEDTVYTSVIDLIQTRVLGLPSWPEGIAERLRREPLVDRWQGKERELRQSVDEAIEEYRAARARGEGEVLMGQGAAQVRAVRPAGQVVRSICDDAERILRERSTRLLA